MDIYEYYEEKCPFYYYDNSYKTLLGSCLIVVGVFGVLLNGWLFATFIHSHLLTFRSHILVLNLCTGSLGRNLLGFPFSSSSAFAKRWIFGAACCRLFAFFNTFVGVFQMTSFLTICLERYYRVKYYKHDKQLSLKLYCGLIGGCWLGSIILSTPPLINFGEYTCDVTKTVCTLSWPSFTSGARHLGYNIPYVIFGGVLPVFTIVYFIFKDIYLERRYYKSQQQKEHRHLTKSLHTACLLTLTLWLPAAVLITWQWAPLMLFGHPQNVPPILALVASVASELATCVPVLCYLLGDERLRAALLGRMRRQYALLHPDRARLFIHA